MKPRLTTNQFIALRSIAREPWDMRWGCIQWRFNRKWSLLFRRDGIKAPLGSVGGIGGRYGYDDIIERAWDAAWELNALGLAEVLTVRCCPESSCHANDRDEFRLTKRGSYLLQKANAASQAEVAGPIPAKISSVVVNPTGGTWWRKTVSLFHWWKCTLKRKSTD